MAKQSLQQSLQQKLSPQQIQLMKLIELSTLELEQKVKDEIETNPALDDDNLSSESFDDTELENDSSDFSDSSESENDFDLDQYISDDEVPAYKLYANNASKDDEDEKAPIVGGHTYLDLLKSQLSQLNQYQSAYI